MAAFPLAGGHLIRHRACVKIPLFLVVVRLERRVPMLAKPIRVVIAEDHPIMCDGLKTVLLASSHIRVVDTARSFTDVLHQIPHVCPDVLVLDLGGMGGAPLTFVEHLHRDFPAMAIVVFSSSVDLAPELLQAGVLGYVAKEELSVQLIAAIQAAHARQTFLSPIAQAYIERATTRRKQYRLAPQEENVLKWLATGFGTMAIAEQLAIDPRTVQNYIVSLRRKTGCAERTQLVTWYQRVYCEQDDV